MARPQPHRRAHYPHTRVLTRRWMDNDPYGHVNNVVHYALFGHASDVAAAQGHFVHVYVQRDGRRPVAELPGALKRALEPLRVATASEEAP